MLLKLGYIVLLIFTMFESYFIAQGYKIADWRYIDYVNLLCEMVGISKDSYGKLTPRIKPEISTPNPLSAVVIPGVIKYIH